MNCNVCSYWTPALGCKHKEPSAPHKKLLPAIVAFTHKGDKRIIETNDFKEGAAYAISFFKEHANNANLIAYLRGETDNLEL
jgi:hypothetical protein